MRKIALFLFLNITIFSIEMPKEIKIDIAREARELYSSNSERNSYIDWQEKAYLSMNNKLEKNNIPLNEHTIILKKLKQMYGNNFVKQNIAVDAEIEMYNKINIAIKKDKEVLKQKNELAKKEINIIEQKILIKKNIFKKIQSNAEKKYPNDFVEQKKYIEAVIENYDLILKNK